MRRRLTEISTWLVINFFLIMFTYFGMAFIVWSWNPNYWDGTARVIVVVLWLSIAFITIDRYGDYE